MENVHNETTKCKKKKFKENVQNLEFYAIKFIY